MPVVTFNLVEGQHSDSELRDLLVRASAAFAEITESPIARIRAFVDLRPASRVCVGGELVSEGGATAPMFVCWALEGRPVEQRHRLLAAFTDLLVEVLGVERSLVRGGILSVSPDNWGIAGIPASQVRTAEIQARAAQEAKGS